MSVKVSSWVWHETPAEVKGNKLVALLALADIADDQGNCVYSETTSQASLAQKSRMSVSQFREVTNWLEDHGFLVTERASRTSEKTYRIVTTADFRRSDSGGRTAENRRSAPPVSGGRTSIYVTDVSNVSTSEVGEPKVETQGQRFAQPLCDVLAVELTANEVRFSVTKSWLDAARLLVDRDGRDPREARALIEWACRDSFWRSNILSMPTFRKQYDKLRLSRERAQGGRPSTVDHGRSVDALLAEREGSQHMERMAVTA